MLLFFMFECGSSPLKLKYIEQSTVLCPTCLLAAHWQPIQLWDRCQESIRTQAGILPVTSSQLGGGWVGGINWGSRNALENVRNMCFLKQTNKKNKYIYFFFNLFYFYFWTPKLWFTSLIAEIWKQQSWTGIRSEFTCNVSYPFNWL